jgi:glucose-6-phosphate isomerase
MPLPGPVGLSPHLGARNLAACATAQADGWLAPFPVFDWVGGRTNELSAIGLAASGYCDF